ncbi:response regulator transcription factor [Actinomyces slackii]|uniref:Response regulator protein vraR n=1 Tax=Actinomyces slackii TaxID=52774 RepID=A0A448KAD8_9ACTO|nr:response regulator transcription factor [Actinomyces slackii]VEG73873.1 Response regulator protein vraR [Actinomyces slackii]
MSSRLTPPPIGVALVDDDAMALAHLESYFTTAPDIRVLLATRSAEKAIRLLESQQVDVLITDIHVQLGALDGAGLTRQALAACPRTGVILLTTTDTDDDLMVGLRAGASGFLLKSASAEEIMAAVRTVHSGGKVVAPAKTARLIDHALASMRTADGSVDLSDREHDVLRLLCDGASNRKIASRLSISEATVKTHVSVLLHKTGASSRLEIVVWAFRHGYASQLRQPAEPVSTPC